MGIIHTVKAKDVDVIGKGELAREQRTMRKEHLQSPTLREAKERPLETGKGSNQRENQHSALMEAKGDCGRQGFRPETA